jgi:antitoxin component of MazEF toxin-antitoxin module
MVEVELREWGHSVGLIVPADKLRELGLKKGDRVDVDIVKKKRTDAFGICKGAKPFEEDSNEHEDIWRKN